MGADLAGVQIGAYRVVRQLGAGGMGSVWLAEHELLGRRAAIKVLHPAYSAEPEYVTRFFNEARAATAIADPGIVQVFDFGRHDDGSAYIIMELLDGESLDKRLARGRLAISHALRIIRQAAGSAGAAHACGIVHRDLKPENIFLVRDPEVAGGERAKIVDFGIAKLAGELTVKTQTAAVFGTPQYMSPEQCRGAADVDARSDVYALGCVLCTLLAGRPPFEGTAGELIALHMLEKPPVPSSLATGIPPEVDALVLRCLTKDRELRFANGTELAGALDALLTSPAIANLPARATSEPARALAVAHTTLSTSSGVTTVPPRRPSSRHVPWIAMGAAALVAGAIWIIHGGSPPAPPHQMPPAALARAVPTTPDLNAAAVAQIKAALARFGVWARDHRGAPCPDLAMLGVADRDPWGHALALTCTDQPADQIVGIVSAGSDGAPGTQDDVASWRLGRDVTDLAAGARWVAEPVAVKAAPKVLPKHPPAKRPAARAPSEPTLILDAHGIPVQR